MDTVRGKAYRMIKQREEGKEKKRKGGRSKDSAVADGSVLVYY